MKKTIIYVFGPKRLLQKYVDGNPLPNTPTGWIKIGKTTVDINTDKWTAALNRMEQIAHTGISETCVLMDVFEYPEIKGRPDDMIRRQLTTGAYTLNNSQEQNKQVSRNKREIKAGNEFIYGASRKQILASIAIFERDMILRSQELDILVKCIKNNYEELMLDYNERSKRSRTMDQSILKMYDNVVAHFPNCGRHPDDRNYAVFKSINKQCLYSIKCSIQRHCAYIDFETYGGNNSCEQIENYLEANDVDKNISMTGPFQGTKNKNKYFWRLSYAYTEFDGNTLTEWFVNNLTIMFDIFENM